MAGCCTDGADAVGYGPASVQVTGRALQSQCCPPCHYIARPKRRVTNWEDYDAALRQPDHLINPVELDQLARAIAGTADLTQRRAVVCRHAEVATAT